MSSSYMIQFPFENVSVNLNSTQLTILIVGLVKVLLLNVLILDRKRVHSFLQGFKSQQLISSTNDHQVVSTEQNSKIESSSTKQSEKKKKITVEDQSLCSGSDIELVLKSLGMICNIDEDETIAKKAFDSDDHYNMFEEKKPSLDEVREAFDVFDGDRDGFIDARDLQKVLCSLGFNEGLDLENCKRMIGAFDENDDGRIDFDEFVNIMENSSI